MDIRRENLLNDIIEIYLDTAQPIGSKYLAHERKYNVSSATIRNEMARLEEEGYIYQPHTSAGRIPTVDGLEYYIQNLIKPDKLSTLDGTRLRAIFSQHGLKGLARESAHYTHAACIIVHNNSDFYYTGFAQLFSQPEYTSAEMVYSISKAIDQLETVMSQFLEEVTNTEPRIYIGKSNPLGNECAAMFIGNKKRQKTLLGLLSPLRTDYKKNMGLLMEIVHYL